MRIKSLATHLVLIASVSLASSCNNESKQKASQAASSAAEAVKTEGLVFHVKNQLPESTSDGRIPELKFAIMSDFSTKDVDATNTDTYIKRYEPNEVVKGGEKKTILVGRAEMETVMSKSRDGKTIWIVLKDPSNLTNFYYPCNDNNPIEIKEPNKKYTIDVDVTGRTNPLFYDCKISVKD
ncbi:MAG: hypothetical protein K2X39_10335 [Silvanigrellaceae bacterium]|nr:hypothetical protein [Silvanigrellaceae bacterium]